MQQALKFRRALTKAGILLLSLLAAAYWFAYRSVRRADSMNALVAHTREVLDGAEKLRLLRASLRNNYWASAYTGDPQFARAFSERSGELAETLSRLRSLTSDNPDQQRILDRLAPALTGEAQRLAAILARKESKESARFPAGTSLAIPAADDTRQWIDQFEKNESDLFRLRSLAVQQSAHLTENGLIVAAILSFSTLLLAGHLIQREIVKRATVEAGLRRAQEILGVRLEEQRTELGHAVEDLHAQIRARKAADDRLRKLNEELEDRVKRRTLELQELNRELEAFSYSVSHDLRAPLRHMDGFSRILQDEFAPLLPEGARHYLDKIRSAAANMSRLVEDLLHLSRVGRQLPRMQRTGLLFLAQEARAEILPEAQGRNISWTFESLPDLEVDPVLVRLVFTNLFSNAVKFTRHAQAPAIEVGWRAENGNAVIFVRDNGAGFDPRFADKLFGVFQRLHRQDQYEGTGIGLATVQRIVHKHGGKVWAESQPGKGATFYFSLPLAVPAIPLLAENVGAAL